MEGASVQLSISLTLDMEESLLLIMADNSTLNMDQLDSFLQDAETQVTYKVAKLIDKYWFLVLIPLGLVGNTLSFLIMVRPTNRKMTTCIYMAAISINDNLMLLMALHAWFVTAMNTHKWFELECKISVYVARFCLQTATFQILAMTIDKYIAIKWPHKSATYSTPKRAKITILVICIVIVIFNVPHFFITALIEGECFGYSVKNIFTKVYSWVNFVLNGIIPFALLISMNYVIVKTVRKSRKMFRCNVGTTETGTREKTMKSAENQLTTMLLLVTTLFFILVLTTYIRYIYKSFVISDTPSKFANTLLISEISYKLYVTNSGINFFLYCISGKKFRNDLKEIMCCRFSSSSIDSRSDTTS